MISRVPCSHARFEVGGREKRQIFVSVAVGAQLGIHAIQCLKMNLNQFKTILSSVDSDTKSKQERRARLKSGFVDWRVVILRRYNRRE